MTDQPTRNAIRSCSNLFGIIIVICLGCIVAAAITLAYSALFTQ